MTEKLTERDLKRELSILGERFHRLTEDDLFILWFLRARFTESEDAAAAALVGTAGEKAVDAVLVDDQARTVVILQGKYRKGIGLKPEDRSSVLAFAELAQRIWEDPRSYKDFERDLDPAVREALRHARERTRDRKFSLQLVFLTTGRVSETERRDAGAIVRRAAGPAQFDVVDSSRILTILEDYNGGVAPAVPSVEIELESGDGVQAGSPLQRYDGRTGIEAWALSARGEQIGGLFEKYRDRIFARNVRGFKGSTDVNDSMEETLEKSPEFFWYFNNGVTIICDDAELLGRSGKERLRIDNPQIINGQQTSRVLHAALGDGQGASVLVRVIRIPRRNTKGNWNFDEFVDKIVKSTNFQNFISEADLRSNDHRQVEIERGFRKYQHYYIRKSRSKKEVRALAGKVVQTVAKEQIAQAVAACDLDPSIVRNVGKDHLFSKEWYETIFPTDDPLYYLKRYWALRAVGYVSRDNPEYSYAKWVVLHFLWKRLNPVLQKRSLAEAFIRGWNEASAAHLVWSARPIFRSAMRFFRSKRGKGSKAADVSTFFKRRGLDVAFERYWVGAANKSRKQFRREWKKFVHDLSTEAGD